MKQTSPSQGEIRRQYSRQMRRKVRKYKRLCLICSIIALFAGILVGFVLGCLIATPSETDKGIQNTRTDIPLRISETVYSLNTTYTFVTDVSKDGASAYVSQYAKYDAPTFMLSIDSVLTPDYYNAQYGSTHRLSGSEAGVALTFTLLSSSQNMPFDPEKALKIQLLAEDGQIIDGYPLMDAEISGGYNTVIQSGQTLTLYKRFDYRPDIQALLLTRYENGYAIQETFVLTQ